MLCEGGGGDFWRGSKTFVEVSGVLRWPIVWLKINRHLLVYFSGEIMSHIHKTGH